MRRVFLCFTSILILGFGTMGLAQTRPTLKKIAAFDLPGPAGKRFDYLTIDEDDHYLISAHLAAGQTYVIDLGTKKVVAVVTDTPGVEGVEYVPELKKFYTSNAGDNTIGVVDLKQMKVIKKLKTEAKPDGSTYAAPFHKLYVSDERGKAEAIVDVQKDEIVGTVFDLDKHVPIAFLPLADGPDVIKFDAGLGRIYVACYSGAISVFHEDDPDHYRKLEDFPVQHAVHSLAVDPKTHRVYTPEQEEDGKPVARMVVYEAVTSP